MSVPLLVSERAKPKMTTRPISIGCLVFEQMDQIDMAGPFEVLSRMPNPTIQIIGGRRRRASVSLLISCQVQPRTCSSFAEELAK